VIPARDPATPARLIDLTCHYTGQLDECIHLPKYGHYAGIDLRKLPKGVIDFNGVSFDVRGVIQCCPRSNDPVWFSPDRIPGMLALRRTDGHPQAYSKTLRRVRGRPVCAALLERSELGQKPIEGGFGKRQAHRVAQTRFIAERLELGAQVFRQGAKPRFQRAQ
jgi:hypothetical protein